MRAAFRAVRSVGGGVLLGFCLLAAGVGLGRCGAMAGDLELKKACLEATLQAVQLEIGRHEGWIEARQKQGEAVGDVQEALQKLQADLKKYQGMKPAEYELPPPTRSVAWVNGTAAANTILYVDDMSRSGPWFHLVGVAGGYAALRPVQRYQVTFYPVYPRSYWHMHSAYVYVAKAEAVGEGSGH